MENIGYPCEVSGLLLLLRKQRWDTYKYIEEHNADMSNHHQANCGSCHQERSPRKGNLHEDFCSFCFLVLVLLGEWKTKTVFRTKILTFVECRGLFWWQICTPKQAPRDGIQLRAHSCHNEQLPRFVHWKATKQLIGDESRMKTCRALTLEGYPQNPNKK